MTHAVKRLGVDFGLKRIGLAVSDPVTGLVFPRPALVRTDNERTFATLVDLVRREAIGEIVVGLPYMLDGEESLTTRQARNFADKLAKATGLPVCFADETLTSAEAESRLKEAGISGKKLKTALDSQAAVLILESYLVRQP
jgi:putative Holliday junction resolvase